LDRQTILIYNSQATGDALIGTHAARFIKQVHPDSTVVFCVRADLTLTTAETDKNAINEVLDILELQDDIDDVGVIDYSGNVFTRRKSINGSVDRAYQQHGWYADLGIVKSALIDIAEEIGWNNIHTETKFHVGAVLPKRDKFTVATAGLLDWERKVGSHLSLDKIFNYIRYLLPEVSILPLGRDVNQVSYLESLQTLSQCHLYLGPMGSMAAAAAGLGLDTINVCSVFPPGFDSPEFYHSGRHYSVTAKIEKHCKTYKCIDSSYYKKGNLQIGNPKTEFSFWTQTCSYMSDSKSCIANITEDDIIEKIDVWFKQLNSKIK
jgi:hypothetical protein